MEEWGGVIWCYMGADKEDPPPLPKIDILARTDGEIVLDRGDFRNYSYLNFLENFVDIVSNYNQGVDDPPHLPVVGFVMPTDHLIYVNVP